MSSRFLSGMLFAGAVLAAMVGFSASAAAADAAKEKKADPPADQTYTGSKRCSSCHFDQMMVWKKSGHSKAFEMLTAKYQKDPKCLKCHTTGYGEKTGYKDGDAALAGVTCETCHGPGSQHELDCQPLAKLKKLDDAQLKLAKSSIWRIKPGVLTGNVCVDCHTAQSHKKSETPVELQKKK